MTKPRKPPTPGGARAKKRRAVKRNPMARALASGTFRARVEESPERYRRQPKHKPAVPGDD